MKWTRAYNRLPVEFKTRCLQFLCSPTCPSSFSLSIGRCKTATTRKKTELLWFQSNLPFFCARFVIRSRVNCDKNNILCTIFFHPVVDSLRCIQKKNDYTKTQRKEVSLKWLGFFSMDNKSERKQCSNGHKN